MRLCPVRLFGGTEALDAGGGTDQVATSREQGPAIHVFTLRQCEHNCAKLIDASTQ